MADKPIAEKKQTQEHSLNETDLTALLELRQMAYRLTETEILHKALTYAIQMTKSEICYLNFVDKGQKNFQLIAWSGIGSEQAEMEIGKQKTLDQAGVWADCVQVDKPIIYNEVQNNSDKKNLLESHTHLIRHASVPLYDRKSLRFILSVGNKTTDYDSTDILQLRLVGDQLVSILHSRQVENALQKARHQYEQFGKHIPIGVYRARTTAQDPLTFEYVNQQFCQGRAVVGGKTKWLRIESRPVPLDNGNTIWHGVQTDITERKEAENAYLDANALLENRLVEIEQLQELLRGQAIRDYLTGLFNRRYLDETIDRELASAKREGSQLSVVMMDIDHFKSINDTYGHQAGDMVLIELGALLNKYSRLSDIACRHGGDEFVVVMPKASPKDAFKRADEWRVAFEERRFSFNDRRFATTLSIGIAGFPLHASSPKGVFQAADQALYQSKMHNNKVSISRRTATKTLRPFNGSEP
jgi:diguanylate cyclase (GGDEF)-like protein